jgi:hypothetical protein
MCRLLQEAAASVFREKREGVSSEMFLSFCQFTQPHTPKNSNLPRHYSKTLKPRLKMFDFIEIPFVTSEMKHPDGDRHALLTTASFDKPREPNG